jgi:hypothetical protein
MVTKNDEILIRIGPGMNEPELLAQLRKVSDALHKLLVMSIEAGARGHQAFFGHLTTAAGAVEMAVFVAEQSKGAPSLYGPGGRPQ